MIPINQYTPTESGAYFVTWKQLKTYHTPEEKNEFGKWMAKWINSPDRTVILDPVPRGTIPVKIYEKWLVVYLF